MDGKTYGGTDMEMTRIAKRLSFVGIAGNILLSAFKLYAGILGKSGAMVSDAVHSLSDVFATCIAYFGVIMSKRPEDGSIHTDMRGWNVSHH